MNRATCPSAHCPQSEQQPGFSLPNLPAPALPVLAAYNLLRKRAMPKTAGAELVHEEVIHQHMLGIADVAVIAGELEHHQVDDDPIRQPAAFVLFRFRHLFRQSARDGLVVATPGQIVFGLLEIFLISGDASQVDQSAAQRQAVMRMLRAAGVLGQTFGQIERPLVAALLESALPDRRDNAHRTRVTCPRRSSPISGAIASK